MPRANRHFVPGLIWHITHRCHERDFLPKFSRDRNSYLRWLGVSFAVSMTLKNFKRRTVNMSKLDRAEI